MVQRGDDVNGRHITGMSVLMHAAVCTSKNNLKCVKVLVHGGANVNAVSDIGSTALMFAAEKGNIDCLKYLIRKGANVNAQSRLGETALMYAAFHGNITLAVSALLRANASINIHDENGQNAAQTHRGNHRYVNSKLLMLLIAAGEEIKDTATFRTDNARQQAACSKPLSEYFQEQESNVSLTHMCREMIRRHLIKINPNQHLFYRVPQLGLSAVLSGYLLYNLSIEKSKYEGVDEETEEDEQNEYDKGEEEEVEEKEEERHQKMRRKYQSDSDYDPESEDEEDEEDRDSEEEWDEDSDDDSESDEHENKRKVNRKYHRHNHEDCLSFDEEEEEETDDSNDEDYDPKKVEDGGCEDGHCSEETEENTNEGNDDHTEDTSDDSSDSDESDD